MYSRKKIFILIDFRTILIMGKKNELLPQNLHTMHK